MSQPVTFVCVSILDLGHPLRGGSSMGGGRTAKVSLCFAIIHLHSRIEGCRQRNKILCLLHSENNGLHFKVFVLKPQLVWNTATLKNTILNASCRRSIQPHMLNILYCIALKNAKDESEKYRHLLKASDIWGPLWKNCNYQGRITHAGYLTH